jgi:formylmethanofuran dehydrogenase subunit D
LGQNGEAIADVPNQPPLDLMRMAETFILIPGRTSDQGCGISEGKYDEKYQREIYSLQVPPADMERLNLVKGDRVRLTSESGQAEVAIVPAKKDELPEGLLFIAYGDISSQLMGADTHGTGMPTSKGIDVELEKID